MQLTATPSAIAARLTHAASRAAVSFGAERVEAMSDDAVLQLLADATEARHALEVMLASASAEVSRRSARELGYQGLAQRKGHRNSTSLVQNITGQSTGDVRRAVQVERICCRRVGLRVVRGSTGVRRMLRRGSTRGG